MSRKKKKKNVAPPRTVTGVAKMNREGALLVKVEEEPDIEYFVKASRAATALDGDTVRIAVLKEPAADVRAEGQVVEVIRRSNKPFVGILHVVGDQAWVLMQGKNMPYDIQIPMGGDHPGSILPEDGESYRLHKIYDEEGAELLARKGEKVGAVIDFWKRGDTCPTGHLVDVLGMPGEHNTEIHAILAEFNLPYRFEPEVAKAADGISEEITEKDLKYREDFRKVLTFTIDPTDAKDFDDALSFRLLENGNYEVGVHIADVTYYVRVGSAVDEEAKNRGTSVYLVDRTVPMLPEKLSNKLCSLRPHEDKLTYSVILELTPQAKIVNSRIKRTIIDSDWRFDYEGAQAIIDSGDPTVGGVPEEIGQAVLTLHALATKIRKKRFAAGSIDFNRPEMKVRVDEKGRPVEIYQKFSKEANWLIEEFMLLANRTVAEFVGKGAGEKLPKGQQKTFVYRIHDEPNPLKIESLRHFAGNFGYKLGPTTTGKEISKSLHTLFDEAAGKPEVNAIEMIALRSMAKAVYSTDNIGHYSLAFPYYTHFTSPIRRYPDMMVHRLLTLYLSGGASAAKPAYETLCRHCSDREQLAADAERASIKYKLVEYMSERVGQEFTGHISGITDWGMYVEVEPTKIEGMIPLREINTDFFDFDEENYRLVGRRKHQAYYLGEEVKVRVKAASVEQRLLDYELIPDPHKPADPSVGRRHHGPARSGSKRAEGAAKVSAAPKKGNKGHGGRRKSAKS
ncbi:MAG: ribonuclease R [Bacteroidales bacterium]|nr:ribonuclease R [Bacteroidales bacterium]